MPQIPPDTLLDANDVFDIPLQQKSTRISYQIEGQESIPAARPKSRSVLKRLRTSVAKGALLASRRLSISLRKAALTVGSTIPEFLNSIIWILETRLLKYQSSSPTDTAGGQKSCEMKLGSVVSFAPTAIGDILWNSKNTTLTPMSDPLCREYMTDTISPSRTKDIAAGLEAGTLDFANVSMEEYLQVSFLMLYHGEEVHIEQKVMYGGGLYNLHACLSQVVNPGQIERDKT